jgi:hypothetical protein
MEYSRKTPHGEGYLPCPLAEGKDLWQPCFEVEGGKDGLIQQVVGGGGGALLCQKSMDLILSRKLMSRVVLPTNHVGKPTLFFFSSPLLMFWVGEVPFSLLEFFFVPFLLSSRLLRILRLHVTALNSPQKV